MLLCIVVCELFYYIAVTAENNFINFNIKFSAVNGVFKKNIVEVAEIHIFVHIHIYRFNNV